MSTFYDIYKDHGVMYVALPALSIMLMVNVTGIISNTLVIFITLFSKNLRYTANYLLAMQCFFDSIHVMAHFYLAYLIYSGRNFDNLLNCLHIMTVPLTGLNVGMSLIFFTAFDRLFAVLFPVIHQRIKKLPYLGTILAICMVYNCYILYLAYVNANEHKDTMVVCLIVEGLHGSPAGVWSTTAASFVFGAVFIYTIIGMIIRFKSSPTCPTRKLYKSLLILCIIFTFSWVGSLTLFFCTVFKFSEELTFFLSLYLGITINIACASNFFVLTRFSTDYRTAAREVFVKFGVEKFFKPSSRIVASS